jgi:glucose-1-phosphate adenylyltransferase
MEEASRFGIMNTDESGRITEFEEKPANPKSNKASMGIYIFKWKKIKQYLIDDEADPDSEKDFGKNVIPRMLANNENMYAYSFDGYWRDVGTIQSLWEANMELIDGNTALNLESDSFKVYTRNYSNPPHYIAKGASVSKSIIADGCMIEGEVVNSIIHSGVRVCAGAKVHNSIIMDGTTIGKGAVVEKSIIDEECHINDKARIGGPGEITVIGDSVVVEKGATVKEGMMVDPDHLVEASKEDKLCQKTSLESFAQEAKASS